MAAQAAKLTKEQVKERVEATGAKPLRIVKHYDTFKVSIRGGDYLKVRNVRGLEGIEWAQRW